jgi:hypothetical protein
MLKHLKPTMIAKFNNDSMNEHIMKLVQVYEQTIISAIIIRSFRMAGLGLDVTTRLFKIQVNDETMRETLGFKAIWE